MKRFSNFNIDKGIAGNHNFAHNDRSRPPKYLIEFGDVLNEFSSDAKSVQRQINKKLQKVARSRQKAGMKKLNRDTHHTKEAVINLLEHHTLADANRVAAKFENLTGTKVYQVSVHKDEGVWLEWIDQDSEPTWDDAYFDSDVLKWFNEAGDELPIVSHKPNENIFHSKVDNNWYFDRQHTRLADTSTFVKHMNYHAHIVYDNLDDLGRSISRNFRNAGLMEDIHTMTAKTLDMQQKPKRRKDKREKSLNHRSLKKAISQNETDTKLKVMRAQLKREYEDSRKRLKESGQAKQSHYMELKKMYERELELLKLENTKLMLENEELRVAKNDYKQSLQFIAKLVDYSGNDLNELDRIVKERLEVAQGRSSANLGLNKATNVAKRELEASENVLSSIADTDISTVEDKEVGKKFKRKDR